MKPQRFTLTFRHLNLNQICALRWLVETGLSSGTTYQTKGIGRTVIRQCDRIFTDSWRKRKR
jgi:hypothetical protein